MTYLLYYFSLFVSYCNYFCVEPITRALVSLIDACSYNNEPKIYGRKFHSPFIINTLMEDDLNVDIE
jgi:hypothetical protein